MLRFILFTLCVTSLIASEEDAFDSPEVIYSEQDQVVSPMPDIPYESPIPINTDTVYLAEHFDDARNYPKGWIKSETKKEDIAEDIAKYDGVWEIENPIKDGFKGDYGLVLKSKAKHAAIAAALNKPFVFKNKPLIVQYEVLLQDGQECGGAYLKLLSEGPDTKDLKKFQDKTPYTIMFGPDKCGTDHKLHFIFRHRNPLNGVIEEKHCKKPNERLEEYFSDKLPHLYTLILNPDNTFEVKVDHVLVNEGSLLVDFTPPVNPTAEIDDPDDRKPDDWDEREKIPAPDAVKPEDWDEDAPAQIVDEFAVMPDGWLENEPTHIPDKDAKVPEDWDSEMDGEWEAPLVDNPKCVDAPGCGPWEKPSIKNPNYKGKWIPSLIDNPNYKGKWRPRRVANPDFYEDKEPFKMHTVSAIGFELWSMSKDILFDNIIITDDINVANQWAADSFDKKRQKIAKDSESFIQRLANLTNEYPLLWLVYILVLSIPIVIILYICCKPSSPVLKEKEEQAAAAEAKKTDEIMPDDVIPEEPIEDEEENEDKEKYSDKEDESDEDAKVEEVIKGGESDAPRKRKPRKE